MNRTIVVLNIIPSGIKMKCLVGFDTTMYGTVLSTESDIHVNQGKDSYSIIFETDTFCKLNRTQFTSMFVKLFMQNLPKTIFDISMLYHYETKDDFLLDMDVAKDIILMEELFYNITKSDKLPEFNYHRSKQFEEFLDDLERETDDDEPEMIDPEDIVEVDDYDEDMYHDINDLMSQYNIDDDDDDKKSKKKKHRREVYDSSRVLRRAKNPKKTVKRHGIIVANHKKDIEKDEKIIKEFLKSFIPGNSSWKKEFRKDVLERWVDAFTRSEKEIKKLEKQTEKKRRSKIVRRKTQLGIEMANKMITKPIDCWYDPKK